MRPGFRTAPLARQLLAAALLSAASLVSHASSADSPPSWCADGLQTVADGICYFAPPDSDQAKKPGENTLVIFLHPLLKADSDWQWQQQLLLKYHAEKFGFSVLMPRGRRGIGPGRLPDIVAWPTSRAMQEIHEDEVIAEWTRARRRVEKKRRRRFDHLLVLGFSNGAYYTNSLALRNRIEADGYGIFAGGQGGKYSSVLGSRTTRRPPIFVGYGTKDPDAKHQRSLVKTLRALTWPCRAMKAPVGHTVTNAQLRAAFRYLLGSESPEMD